ncbi:hypothetical protein L484_006630 [Morus notabilis]|uniref:Uncharacterized protein n=1 Tax=Morus notabilis TaxID=981085 RepID=W9RVZ9_9ROSA|nr:hypothetical protein L484_006630 [Morus notabilis]
MTPTGSNATPPPVLSAHPRTCPTYMATATRMMRTRCCRVTELLLRKAQLTKSLAPPIWFAEPHLALKP